MSCFTCGAGWAVWGTGERKYCFNCKPLHATLPQPKALCPYQVTHQDTQNTRPSFRNSDPPTARAAAPGGRHLNERQIVVLRVFQQAHPRDLTNEDVIDALGEEQVGNISSRVTELRDRQYIKLSGNKRKSRQGKMQQAHAWVNFLLA